jgi:hypothetical protein
MPVPLQKVFLSKANIQYIILGGKLKSRKKILDKEVIGKLILANGFIGKEKRREGK